MNFLTIHGRSRVSKTEHLVIPSVKILADTNIPAVSFAFVRYQYPGLHIWARNSGKKIAVKVPPGCLLVQAGKQLEAFSGGLVKGQSATLIS
jgi:hypothetical protein